jgi:hypothetical protein
MTDISEVLTAYIIRMMMTEAVSTSEMLVNFCETTQCKRQGIFFVYKKAFLGGGFSFSTAVIIIVPWY